MLGQKYFEVEDFPIGSRVKLPSGRSGIVVAHKGYESKFDPFMRVMIKLDGGDRQDVVQLQPQMLRHFNDSKDRIQSWCGDQLVIGDVVRLPSGRLATVLAIAHTARRGNALGAVTARIHGEDDTDGLVELAAHLVRRVAISRQVEEQRGPELLDDAEVAETTSSPANVSMPRETARAFCEEARGRLGRERISKSDRCRVMLEAIERLGYLPTVFPAWDRSALVREHKERVARSLGWTSKTFSAVWRYLQVQGLIIESDVAAYQPAADKAVEHDFAPPEAKILGALTYMGYNPQAFPCGKAARKATDRRSVKALTGLTSRQFDRTWRQLRKAGQIVEKDRRGPRSEAVENDR